ncbi:M23 family metallopeptidase [Chryseobacterium hagamense]|uniref:Peptidase M23 domain-containing protein n=1 Tax=Chryseobacterium hagamense TaxID=395935 RepID=A0A511YLW4_9FLAO|nr:M23 family metallopeptidase [Chryseobacterium hagamense]GEN76136.1 hypothetical protein CHA01nite_18760 [Chryseobacterium hagamense]
MSKRGVSKIAGNPAPEVGTASEYTIEEWYPATPVQLRDPSGVIWELFKKRPDGKFTATGIRKKGSGTFTFGEVSSKHTYRLEAYLYHPEGSGPTTLEIRPKQANRPKITKVDLLHIDSSPGNRFSFTDRLIAQAHSVGLVGKKILFTLWEDDAAGPGHHASNLVIDRKEALVQRDGTACVSFMLSKALVKKALDGEIDPRALEFYVTAEHYFHQKQASCNVEIKNPLIFEIPRKTPPSKPASAQISKPKGSPASGKPASKKEERGLLEKFSDGIKELWDWQETRGTIEKNRKPVVQRKEGKSVSMVEGHENNTCFCKANNLYWGKYFSCQERKKIIEIANRLGCKPDYLTSAVALETKGTFDPKIVNSRGYTGLIQIGDVAATNINKRKKTNISAGINGNMKKMSRFEQLTYVEYYLEPFKGKLNTLADFYLAILMPVDCGKGNQRSHVVFDKNLILDHNSQGNVIKNTKWVRKKGYVANPVFHKEKREDGKTYVWEIANEIEEWYKKGETNKEFAFSCQKKKINSTESFTTIWHDPVDNPRLTKYNYGGLIKPSSGTYGWCRRNPDGSKKYHSGFDFFAMPGKDKVYSCLRGNVCEVKYSDSAGWIIKIKIQNVKDLLEQEKKVNYTNQFKDELRGIDLKETDDVYFVYMHLDSTLITEGDANRKKEIDAGTILGYAGVSGSIASGGKAPHLHLEITTVLNAYGHGESVRTNPARFVKLNSYNTKDQDEESRIKHIYKR